MMLCASNRHFKNQVETVHQLVTVCYSIYIVCYDRICIERVELVTLISDSLKFTVDDRKYIYFILKLKEFVLQSQIFILQVITIIILK